LITAANLVRPPEERSGSGRVDGTRDASTEFSESGPTKEIAAPAGDGEALVTGK
jgi:hypothetical protein